MSLPRFLGIDTGDICHLALRERIPGNDSEDVLAGGVVRWLWFDNPPIEDVIDTARAAIKHFGVEGLVVDSQPQTAHARYIYDLIPYGSFIWKSTEGQMSVREHDRFHVERRWCFINREELLTALVEEFNLGPKFIRFPTPRTSDDETMIDDVTRHLKMLRRKIQSKKSGGEEMQYERGENHFGFACAFARLAEELAYHEGVLVEPAGAYLEPKAEVFATAERAPGDGSQGLLRERLPIIDWTGDPGSYSRGRLLLGGRMG